MLPVTLLLLVAGVFLVASFGKVRHPAALADVAVQARRLQLPRFLSRRAGHLLVSIEIITAVMLIVPAVSFVGAVLAIVLLGGMAFGIHRIRAMGAEPATCRCFGSSEAELRTHHVVRNVVLAAIAAAALTLRLADGPPRLTPAQWALAVIVASAATLVVVHLDTLIFVFSPAGDSAPRGGTTPATRTQGQ